MKINMYGLGRSGTKALQQYIAMSMLEKYNRIGINYEPLLWANVRVLAYCRNGANIHKVTPFFCDNISNQTHRSIIKSLSFYEHGITKFIHACGRIQAINEIMEPDHTIVVIRDAYEVINSLVNTSWDFFTRRFSQTNDWQRFKEESIGKQVAPDFEAMTNEVTYEWEKYFLYWYALNYYALDKYETYGRNVCFVWFRKFSVKDLLKRQNLPLPHYPIEQCYGGLIHKSVFYTIESHLSDLYFSLYNRIFRRNPMACKHIQTYLRKKDSIEMVEKFSGAGKPKWIWETPLVRHVQGQVQKKFDELPQEHKL